MIDWDKYKGATSVDIVYRDGGVVIDTCRVNRPKQTKTVADAVEYYGEWPNEAHRFIYYCLESNKFVSHAAEYKDTKEAYKVCTRDEFEAYVKEQESSQVSCSEDEKWTHRTHDGDRCRVIYEGDKRTWILTEYTQDKLVKNEDLKPIKPSISESKMMERIKYRAISIDDDDEFGAKVRAWLDEYDII